MVRWGWVVGFLLIPWLTALVGPAAAVATGTGAASPDRRTAAARDISSLLLDAESGRVLEERNAGVIRPAGSFPQLMVLLLGLEQVAAGVLPLDVPVVPGPAAAALSRIPLREDETYVFSDLLKAIAVSGAADATMAVAETVAGSVPASIDLMNARGRRLGMADSTFADLGMPPGAAGAADAVPSRTTAGDLARLARALLAHDLVLHWTGLTGLPFHDGAVILRNVNPMVGSVAGVDGLHVSPGVGIVATANRGGMRLVAVVLGGSGGPVEGYALAAELIEHGFSHYERVDVVKAGERVNIPVRVRGGAVGQVVPVTDGAFCLVRRRGDEPRLELRYQLPGEMSAPVRRNQPVGELIVQQGGAILSVIPLVSPVSVSSAGILAAAP